ncbi:hypothetical protein DNTS_029349 [Danionella cerebrum]|uniref:Serine/arginine-rich splicing factor 3 n=1 Tax=Danionella cerebrum TaxID=2873325 RepID=A0A553Q7U8_9TELE|nr:hypothetical protein DNTS_029349 [Danionella translucida]TRY86004.1 hypothetical protein DNTS_029349 [Danionella translucida]TRY86005.1 hypothetical protein DNTS_029349 [Danionella translucida]
MHRDCPLDCKVYVGNLGNNGNKSELERAFGYYGPLRSVWVARNPPGFAFVEFEDPRDATDAVRELDGRTLCGCRVRVELSNGEKRSRSRGPPPSWNRRPRDDYRRRSPPARRSEAQPQCCFTMSHHHASPHHPLSQSTSPQFQQPACPNQLAALVSHDPGMANQQVAPAHWFLSISSSSSNINTQSAAALLIS